MLFSTLHARGALREEAEYDVKAAFLFNFTRFVEWPENPEKKGQPFVIAVMGEDPFGPRLDQIVLGEKIGDRPLEIRRITKLEQITSCDALFIARSETSRLERILVQLRDKAILTISDISDFAEMGGMVEFVTENSRIRFHINVDVAREAKLAISAKLLRPAVVVKSRKTSQNIPHEFSLSAPLFAFWNIRGKEDGS